MKSIRLLLVEDDATLCAELKRLYRSLFAERGFESVTVETATTVDEARELARAAKPHPYDLVSLDVNLGDKEETGLDVLNTLRRFQSAWMVAMLTGVETDRSLDGTIGREAGERLRRQLRSDAYGRFPAERLLIVEKPGAETPGEEATRLMRDRVRQICLLYEQVGRSRYIFRPIEVAGLERVSAAKGKQVKRKFIETSTTHWQIRFNCGDIRTLPDRAGYRTLHHLLSLPTTESLTPEQALVIEPKNEKGEAKLSSGEDPVGAYFSAQGIDWSELSATQQEKLITAALSLRFRKYVELRGYKDEEDLAADEADELERITDELGPLAPAAETAYLRMRVDGSPEDQTVVETESLSIGAAAQEGLHAAGGNYEKTVGRKGYDSPAAQNFRARWKRTKD